MPHLQLTIPAQDGDRASLKINPREVKAWLEDLPFMDLQRCTRLAREQLRVMNRQGMAASQRLAILGGFLATYQRLDEAQTGDRTLSTQLRHLCQDIGFGYKIVTNDLVNKPSGFMEARNLPLALLGAIHILGLQLLDCYTGYRRAPRALWSECLALYAYAWQHGRETWSGLLPGYGEQQIDRSFRLVALLRLADPYRLPAGMAAALQAYFRQRIDLCALHSEPPEGKNCFQLSEAFQQAGTGADMHLYVELDELLARMQEDILKLQQYRQVQVLGLPAEIPVGALLRALQQTVVHWHSHPTRSTGREETHARVELVSGLDSVYCMVNQGRCFDATLFLDPQHDQHIDLGVHPAGEHNGMKEAPQALTCSGINRSNGGLALRYCGAQAPQPRVGQLLALRRQGHQTTAGWVVAVCRWLVQGEADASFELGLQYLTREPRAVVIRKLDDGGTGGPFQPAIAATQKRGDQRVHTLIARSGAIHPGNRVVIYENGRQQTASCSEILESSPGFERLLVQPL
jgi:hypothetical protein